MSTALPKLSARRILTLLHRLQAADPTIARTVLNVALDAADPVDAATRYLAQYHDVAAHLTRIDPAIARTLANATFMARVPEQTARGHIKRFAAIINKLRDNVPFARTVARAACRA